MKSRITLPAGLFLLFLLALVQSCGPKSETAETTQNEAATEETADSLRYPREKHFRNVRQLTFGGNNAEAYFSFDGQKLSFQSDNPAWGNQCDQIYYMPLTGYAGEHPPRISNGKGRTTCAYFMPGDTAIIYASTHLASDTCPQAPHLDGKYVWGVFDSYDIFVADLKGNIIRQLTNEPGYDAEPTVSPDGQKIVFTSTRSGDLELWTMNIDGTGLHQVTHELGYDGGAFFSPDSKKLVFRASRPKTEEEVKTYKELLSQGLVQPTHMEIFTCNVDGSDLRQITNLGGANWAPFFHPSGEKILFSSNFKSVGKGRPRFNIYSVNLDGTGLEQITYDDIFDAFIIFSPDGKKVAFSSNRHNGGGHDTNVFVADWIE